MATTTQEPNSIPTHLKNPTSDVEGQTTSDFEVEVVDSSVVLGANDGWLSTASLMMGVGAVSKNSKTMIFAGIAILVAGAYSMAIGEFVSVYSQYDTEIAQLKRDIGCSVGACPCG